MTQTVATAVSALSLEAIHDLAASLAQVTLPDLLRWLASSPGAPALVDRTITALGVPEPDTDEDGVPIAGSILRKLLYWSQVEQIAATLAERNDARAEWAAEGLV